MRADGRVVGSAGAVVARVRPSMRNTPSVTVVLCAPPTITTRSLDGS
jgi:hypothetical protein